MARTHCHHRTTLAKSEGFPVVGRMLLAVAAAEKIRKGLCEEAKAAVDQGNDISFGPVSGCHVCGYTLKGDAPDMCPVCGPKKEKFQTHRV